MNSLADSKLILACVITVVVLPKWTKSICNPHEACNKNSLGSKVPNFFDCRSYFICVQNSKGQIKPSDVAVKCPDGQVLFSHYHASINRCERRDSCYESCLNFCNGTCTNYLYERIADVKDCSIFYTCTPDLIKVKTKCPSKAPFFDGVNCQKDKYECCSCCDECTPYCHKVNTQIPDPYDCRSFYLCLEKGFPRRKNRRYQCPDLHYFQTLTRRCVAEDKLNPCINICKNETKSN